MVEGRRPLHLIFLVEIFNFNCYSDLSPFISPYQSKQTTTLLRYKGLGQTADLGMGSPNFPLLRVLKKLRGSLKSMSSMLGPLSVRFVALPKTDPGPRALIPQHERANFLFACQLLS